MTAGTMDRATTGPAATGPSTGDFPAPPTGVPFGWRPRVALAAASGLAAVLLVVNILVAGGHHDVVPAWLRTLLVFTGACLLPGIPLVVLLRIPSRSVAAALTFALSMSATMLAAQGTMVAGLWNPVRTQTFLVVTSLVLIVVAFITTPSSTRTGRLGLGRSDWTRLRAWQAAGLLAALVALVAAGSGIDVMRTGAMGVIGQSGLLLVIGLALLGTVLVSAFRAPRVDVPVMAAATTVVIAYNVMLVGIATGQTSIPNSFVHRGFVTIIAHSGELPAQMDARFSWAGFFTGSAHLQIVAAMGDLSSVLLWVPLVFGIMLCFGLYAVAVNITGNVRRAWLAVLLFQAVNWYQQDYYAPQAVALIGFTAIIGTMLWQLRAAPFPRPVTAARFAPLASLRRIPGRVPGFGPARTLAVGAALLFIVVANTVSHQMTPILTIFALLAFTLTGTTRYRTLWLGAGLVFAAWFTYGAEDYWLGHLQQLLDEIGAIGNAVDSGVTQRLTGDPLYQRMQYLRMAVAAGFVLVGAVGWLLWSRSRKRAMWVGALLCAAPGCLLFLQSYGGEMILRAFLMSAPTVAPFAAAALAALWHRYGHRLGSARTTAVVLVGAIVVTGLVETTNRGLNTAFEASTRDEVDLTAQMMEALPPNTAVMTFSHAPHSVGLRRSLDPMGPRFGYIDSYPCLNDLARCTLDRGPDYVFITHQGVQMVALQYGRTVEQQRDDVRRIMDTGDFLVDTDTEPVLILRRTDAPALGLNTEHSTKGNALL